MREILFRGKRVDNGEWVYWNEFGEYTEPLLNEFDMHSHVDEHEVIPETVGPYTGLFDKNGNKVFEGDIVENDYGGKSTVEYWDAGWSGFVLVDGDETWEGYLGNCDHIEVIGSIHDKGELINE